MDNDNLLFKLLKKIESYNIITAKEISDCEYWLKKPFTVYGNEEELNNIKKEKGLYYAEGQYNLFAIWRPKNSDTNSFEHWASIQEIVKSLNTIYGKLLKLTQLDEQIRPEEESIKIRGEIKVLVKHIIFEWNRKDTIDARGKKESLVNEHIQPKNKDLSSRDYQQIASYIRELLIKESAPQNLNSIEDALNNFKIEHLSINKHFYSRLIEVVDKSLEINENILTMLKADRPKEKGLEIKSIGEWKMIKQVLVELEQRGLKDQQPERTTLKKKKTPKAKPIIQNFGFEGPIDKIKILYSGLLKIDCINEVTSKENFVSVLSENWNSCKSTIHWDCETTELAYIISQIKSKFKSLTPFNIEKSKKFISKQGTQIKANNLYKAKHSVKHFGLKDQKRINDALKKFLQ